MTTAPEHAAVNPRATGAFAPFAFPLFAAIWWASLISNFGSLIQSVGASWLMTAIAPSPEMVAYVQTASTAPIMLFSLIAGALADIWDRRLLMLLALTAMMAASALLVALAVTVGVGPWSLLAFTFLIGIGSAFYAPAWQASVTDQVPREHLGGAVALNSVGFNLARSIGPAVGGVIVATAGAAAAFAVNAVSYIALIVVLARWRRPKSTSTLPPEPLWAAIRAGVRYVALSPPLLAVLARSGLFGVCAAALWALMPLVAREGVNGGPLTYGIFLGAFGAGAMAGALASSRLRARYPSGVIVDVASLAFAGTSVAVGLTHSAALVTIALLFAGAAWVLALSTFNIGVQTSAPRWVAGRAIALYQMTAFAGLAVGAALWGIAAREYGLSAALYASAAAMMAAIVLGRFTPLPSSDPLDLSPWTPPAPIGDPHVVLDPRSGPIVTVITYKVDLDRSEAFSSAMHALGRIRRRDGAQHWTLLQDLDDPETWTERFQSPTWLDHVRRRERFTVADVATRDRVAALHRGPLTIHRYLERPPGAAPLGTTPPPSTLPDATLQH